ncbi:MAG: hypothetical protein MJ202_10490 [Lentisphaeria bacterium]|nr:hypothetical protein [Lentisphaeria bacterium]
MLEGKFSSGNGNTPAFWGYKCFTPEVLAFLRKIQLDYNLSNSAFAKVLGIHCTTLKKWLDGRILSCSPENYQSILKLLKGDFDEKLREARQVDAFLQRVRNLYGQRIRVQYALLELYRKFGVLYLQIRSIPRIARSFIHIIREFLEHPVTSIGMNHGDAVIERLLSEKEISASKSFPSTFSSELEFDWGIALYQHRVFVHLSQSSLADLFDVDWTTIRNWEHRKRCGLRGGNMAKIQIFLRGEADSYLLNHYHYISAQREIYDFLPLILRRLLEKTQILLQHVSQKGNDAVSLLFHGLGQCLEQLQNLVLSVSL